MLNLSLHCKNSQTNAKPFPFFEETVNKSDEVFNEKMSKATKIKFIYTTFQS